MSKFVIKTTDCGCEVRPFNIRLMDLTLDITLLFTYLLFGVFIALEICLRTMRTVSLM